MSVDGPETERRKDQDINRHSIDLRKTWHTLPKISLATLDAEIVDPEIAVKSEMLDALKVHDVQT